MSLHTSKERAVSVPVRPAEIILVGEELLQLSEKTLLRFALQVSRKLRQYPHTMLQFSQTEGMASIRKERAVACVDENMEELLSYCQVWDYKDQHPEWGNTSLGNAVELGSLLSMKEDHGYGRRVLKGGIELAARLFPGRQHVAIVESNNLGAQKIINDVGGYQIMAAESDRIRDQFGVPVVMHVYDITRKT